MDLGKIQKLEVVSKENGRIYLSDGQRKVVLNKDEGKDLNVKDKVYAFVYNGHKDFEAT